MTSIKCYYFKYPIVAVILLSISINLMAQYEENDAYLVITGMKLNENPQIYIKDPSYGKDAIVKVTHKNGQSIVKKATEFPVKKNGLTYYTADFKILLDADYAIEMKFNDGSIINIPDYKLLSKWKTHFYFHSTDGSLSPSSILRSQPGLDNELRLCVFAVYPYKNYIELGGMQTFTATKTPIEKQNNIGVFPNPADDYAVLKFDLDKPAKVNIAVKTLSGLVAYNYSAYYQQGKNQINLMSEKQLPAGLYFVQLVANGREYNQKLLVF